MNLYSHPEKLLIDHLRDVATGCKGLISSLELFESDSPLKPVMVDLGFLMGAFHDLGKGTQYFQQYLLDPEHRVSGPKNHALISALFVKEASKVLMSRFSLPDLDKEIYSHMAFTAVKRHHGRLLNFADEMYVNLKGETNGKALMLQIEAFEEAAVTEIVDYFVSALCINYSFSDFKAYIRSEAFLEDMPSFYEDRFEDGEEYCKLPAGKRLEYYYVHQLLFGCLLLADKSDVILDEVASRTVYIRQQAVHEFKHRKKYDQPKSVLDVKKNEAFDLTLKNAELVFSRDVHIYSLTLPTGLGKTITSLSVALKLRELLGGSFRRLVVCIPFTSIIDQNFEVYRDIICTDRSDVLLKHHHLAEPEYKMDDQVLSVNKGQFLIETWQSELIVTTFVQLFHSTYSNDKSLLMKLPNLANAIVILDEAQSIPYQYWKLIRSTLQTLGSVYNCYFILMSATQPLLFKPEKEIRELVPGYKRFFKYFRRTRLMVRIRESISLSDFAEVVETYISGHTCKDILIILNTRKHSKQVFERLREVINPEDDEIYYLSTLITPFERKEIIRRIKMSSGKRKIVVSTQLIEAGVDISVDTVFRNVAPIDSIIQAAGRANRYGEKDSEGEVYLYDVEELKKATSAIYGVDLIQKTKNVMQSVDEMHEEEYLSLIEQYYKEVAAHADNHLCKYLNSVLELRFEDVSEFTLIEERESESVFVQLNERAKEVWDQYTSIYQDRAAGTFERRERFSLIKAEFYDFVINVPVPWGKKTIDFDSEPVLNFYVSDLDRPSVFYKYDPDNFASNTGYQAVSTLTF